MFYCYWWLPYGVIKYNNNIIILVHPAHSGFFDDNAPYKFTYLLTSTIPLLPVRFQPKITVCHRQSTTPAIHHQLVWSHVINNSSATAGMGDRGVTRTENVPSPNIRGGCLRFLELSGSGHHLWYRVAVFCGNIHSKNPTRSVLMFSRNVPGHTDTPGTQPAGYTEPLSQSVKVINMDFCTYCLLCRVIGPILLLTTPFYSALLCKRCTSYGNSVCLSVRPSHAGIVSKRRHVPLYSLHCQIAKYV